MSSSVLLNSKLLAACLILLSLKNVAKGITIALIAVLVLAIFTAIASALCELTQNISNLWIHSDSITKLFLIVIAVYCVKKALPYIVTLHKKGWL